MGPFPSKFRCVLRASGENLRIPGSYFEYSGHLWLLQRLSWQYPQTVCIQEHSTHDNLQCSGSSINSTCAETSKNSTFFEAIRSRHTHQCLRQGLNSSTSMEFLKFIHTVLSENLITSVTCWKSRFLRFLRGSRTFFVHVTLFGGDATSVFLCARDDPNILRKF